MSQTNYVFETLVWYRPLFSEGRERPRGLTPRSLSRHPKGIPRGCRC